MTYQIRSTLSFNEEKIQSYLEERSRQGIKIQEVLARARNGAKLNLAEIAALLHLETDQELEDLYRAAREIKEKIFGRRIVLFAPLYISNVCANNCLYCGFRRENREAERKSLSISEIIAEASFLAGRGYRRVLLVAGEDPSTSTLETLCEAIEAIYRKTDIRIVHVNAAPMSVDDFSKLKTSGAGVYQCFQETYHPETYHHMHPSGHKSDYDWRISVMERAVEGGFDDVGMGVLHGLYDYRFEVLSLIAHARDLEDQYGIGPHTISVPRFRPALGAALKQAPSPVSDPEFQKIVAVYRLAVPYAGVVVSTREGPELRDRIIHLGASQISAGSRTDIGGYTHAGDHEGTSQFSLYDSRSLDEVVRSVMDAGLLPSFCTSCYRSGRTGEQYRDAVEKGKIRGFCRSNALFSLMEYLQHHAGEETKTRGVQRIRKILSSISDSGMRQKLEAGLQQIAEGKEDVHD